MNFRRVVTSIDATGKSVFLTDGEVENKLELGSFIIADVWATRGEPSVGANSDSRNPDWQTASLPAAGDSVLRYAVIPPTAVQEEELRAVRASHPMQAGDFQVEHDDPSMHTTDSVDCGFVLSGEIGLELDDGEIKWLQPGDCFVQQGTRHAWRNRGEVPAVIGVVMLGAQRG